MAERSNSTISQCWDGPVIAISRPLHSHSNQRTTFVSTTKLQQYTHSLTCAFKQTFDEGIEVKVVKVLLALLDGHHSIVKGTAPHDTKLTFTENRTDTNALTMSLVEFVDDCHVGRRVCRWLARESGR